MQIVDRHDSGPVSRLRSLTLRVECFNFEGEESRQPRGDRSCSLHIDELDSESQATTSLRLAVLSAGDGALVTFDQLLIATWRRGLPRSRVLLVAVAVCASFAS